jgi:hypothetical protein
MTSCSTCGTPRNQKETVIGGGGETKSNPSATTKPGAAKPLGNFPSISLQFLSRLVWAFDYSNLAGIRAPMQGVSKSIGAFRPMSLWSSQRSQEDQSIAGIEVWLSRCAVASAEVRGSAVVGLQKLALASGLLTSLLRLAQTTRRLEDCVIPKDNEKQTKHFMEYLFARVEDAARDCLFLPVSNKWECESCSSLNDPSSDICGLCNEARSEQSTSHKASSLRSKTGTSLTQPTRPTNIKTYRDLSNGMLSIMAQLARYRLGSSLNGVTTVYEPFLVEISCETFNMFLSLLRHVLLETEVKKNETKTTSTPSSENAVVDDYEFEQVVLDLVIIIKLNVRRQYAARVGGIDLSEVYKFLEGIEHRNILPAGSTAIAEIGAVRLELAKASGIVEVIKLMNANPSIMAVQASGCHALLEHVVFTKDQGHSVAMAGGVNTVLAAVLFAHQSGHLEVLLSGLRLLSRLGPSCYVFEGRDGELLVDHVLSIMKHNLANVEVHLTAMRTLSLLAATSIDEKSLSQRASSIVPIITESLLSHAEDKDIQKEGCLILGRLASDASNISIISRFGGIGAARTIIDASENDPDLQRMALTLLTKLMLSDDFKDVIPPKEVLKCMKMFQDNQMIHARCLHMLYSLMRVPTTRQQAVRHGVLDVTCQSMRDYSDILDVQIYGSGVMSEYVKTLPTDGIQSFDLTQAHLVCLAYDKFGKKQQSMGRAMLTRHLWFLQKNPSDVRLGVIADSLQSDRVCRCMLQWPNNAELQAEGIWCIEYLTPTQRDQITNAKGLRAICNAMKR